MEKGTKPLKILSIFGFAFAGFVLGSYPSKAYTDVYCTCWSSIFSGACCYNKMMNVPSCNEYCTEYVSYQSFPYVDEKWYDQCDNRSCVESKRSKKQPKSKANSSLNNI